MDKIAIALQVWGAVALCCAAIAKALPAGKAQSVFAFLGSFAAPKLPAKPEEPKS